MEQSCLDDETTQGATPAVVAVRGVTKSFGSSRVLSGINLEMLPGEVIALAGENGAGKSTLLKVLAGILRQDDGQLLVDGEVQMRHDVRSARTAGIAIIPQELAPVPDLAIYENVFLGRELKLRLGFLDRKRMIRETSQLLADFGLTIDPRTKMRLLSTATQQLVEIVKSSSTGCRVLLLDEPTSAISEAEVQNLFKVIGELKDRQVTMVYTTHKMSEIRAVADRVAILRDGLLIANEIVARVSDEEIITAMIGRELGGLYPQLPVPHLSDPVLEVEGLKLNPSSPEVSFSVSRGQLVAFAGLMGAGRTELIEAIFGVRDRTAGTVRVSGREVPPNRPSVSIRAGMAFVPEDRKIGGAVLGLSILANALLPSLRKFSTFGWVRKAEAKRAVNSAMSSVHLKAQSLSQLVSELSGGNQQKVVIGKWLTADLNLLLLDEPTRGVDVGARGEIYRVIANLAEEQNLAVLFASSDMPEVIGLSHEVIVIRDGAIVDKFDSGSYTDSDLQEHIFRASAGAELNVKGNG